MRRATSRFLTVKKQREQENRERQRARTREREQRANQNKAISRSPSEARENSPEDRGPSTTAAAPARKQRPNQATKAAVQPSKPSAFGTKYDLLAEGVDPDMDVGLDEEGSGFVKASSYPLLIAHSYVDEHSINTTHPHESIVDILPPQDSTRWSLLSEVDRCTHSIPQALITAMAERSPSSTRTRKIRRTGKIRR